MIVKRVRENVYGMVGQLPGWLDGMLANMPHATTSAPVCQKLWQTGTLALAGVQPPAGASAPKCWRVTAADRGRELLEQLEVVEVRGEGRQGRIRVDYLP